MVGLEEAAGQNGAPPAGRTIERWHNDRIFLVDSASWDDRSLAMQPSRLTEFITLVSERFEDVARSGEAPVLVTSAAIRPFVRSIVERFRAQTPVLSQAEIHPRARLKTVGSI